MADTLYSALHAVAQERPDQLAYVVVDRDHDERRTFAEFDRQAAAVAAGLVRRGFRAGDRLAVWLPNFPEWLVLQIAASRIGVAVLSINTKYRIEELGHLLALGRPRGIAFSPGFLGIDFAGMLERTLEGLDDEVVELTIAVRSAAAEVGGRQGVTFDELAAASPDALSPGAPGDALTVLFPTSGTTSLPKLAAHDQASVVRHSANAAGQLDLRAGDVLLCPLPLCGVFGYNAVFAALLTGAMCVSQTAFSRHEAALAGERHAATHFVGTDPMLEALVAQRRPTMLRRGIVSITGDHPQELIESAQEVLGVALTDVYGSSECFALLAFWPPDAAAASRAIKGGAVVPDVEVRVVDVAERHDLGPGERGEILFRGYNVLRCYLGNPQATDNVLQPDGWYRTGDLGFLDAEGRLVFLSRLDDSLRLRGFLVNPGEIEMLLERHPAVRAVQVVGVKDGRGNDLPVAFVIPRGEDAVSADELQAFCRERAASYKVPDRIWFVDDFPRTVGTNGAKVQRNVLRDRARSLLAGADRT